MQADLSPADRKLLWGAAGLFILLAAGTALLAPAEEEAGPSLPSTYSTAPGGARAAYLLLEELGYPVRQWEEPLASLPRPGKDALLVLADPVLPPTAGEREALLRFLKDGGRLLICGPAVRRFFPDAALTEGVSEPAVRTFSSTRPGGGKIALAPPAFWRQLRGSETQLYGEPGAGVVVTWQVGAGRVLWWAAATPLTNGAIRRAGNLPLFLEALAPAKRIYWDEYYHGQRGSLWAYIRPTPLPWALLQFALLVLAVLFTYSRRSGPVLRAASVSRLAPLEFVDTLGGLYQRAGAAAVAVDVSLRHLRRSLQRRLGLPASTPDAEMARAAAERLGWEREPFAGLLASAGAAARIPRLPPREALSLVRALERRAGRLDIHKAPSGEKG